MTDCYLGDCTQGANNVALAKKDAEKALAATEEELLELLQQQDDEAARLAQLQVQLEAEREALVKQHDSRLKVWGLPGHWYA